MQLRELQRAFQRRVLSFAEGIEPELSGAENIDFETRLDAYVGGYRTRLVEALGTTYPVLKLTLGSEEFEQQMRLYIDSAPSRHYSVRQYGAQIAQRMLASDPNGTGPALAELARWEWMLADVFDASDDDPLSVTALATVPPEAWPSLSFTLRACVRRFETRTNVVEWWRAANELCDRPPGLVDTAAGQWLLWRRGVRTLFRSLNCLEADLLDEVGNGITFGALCELIAHSVDESEAALRAASFLRGWIAEELIADFSVTSRVE